MPTDQQLKAFYLRCIRISNLLQTIELVRFDDRTQQIVILVGESIQIELLSNGEVIIG